MIIEQFQVNKGATPLPEQKNNFNQLDKTKPQTKIRMLRRHYEQKALDPPLKAAEDDNTC